MNTVAMKSGLTTPRQSLVVLMQRVNHGRIERLPVLGGEPLLDPPPRIVREIKFGGENGPRPEVARSDFELKAQVRDLFAQLDALGDGVVESLEVKHGLPFRMIVQEVPA